MYKETTKYSAIYVVTLHKAAFGGLRNSHEVMKINSMWYIETHLLVVEYQCFQIVLCGSSALNTDARAVCRRTASLVWVHNEQV